MKSVLISIKPKWCELIASGKKTIEVRKTRPKCDTPFKCYIYCTKDFKPNIKYGYKLWAGRGKVLGEFVCDRIVNIDCDSIAPFDKDLDLYIDKQTCVNRKQFFEYTNGYCCFGWHISRLVIYDRPKSIKEFYHYGVKRGAKVTRPPQSWCYAEKI